jgi:hypothetical protein
VSDYILQAFSPCWNHEGIDECRKVLVKVHQELSELRISVNIIRAQAVRGPEHC